MRAPDSAACPFCAADDPAAVADGAHTGQDASPSAGHLAHLYLCLGLSTHRIAEQTGISRPRVTRRLRQAGVDVRPRGAGRARPPAGGEPRELARLITTLYERARLNSREIAELTGIPERTIRDRLRRYGVTPRTRGGWDRSDRATVPADALRPLYGELGLTAAEVGHLLGVSAGVVLRSAHDFGVPVRTGGVVPVPGPVEIELVRALYADSLVDAVLTAHHVPRVPPGGPISDRFPQPVPLTTPLVKDLYWGCGIALTHIELLTGQAAESVRRFMRRAGIPLRNADGRNPFLRRWRTRPGGAEGEPRTSPPRTRRASRAAGET